MERLRKATDKFSQDRWYPERIQSEHILSAQHEHYHYTNLLSEPVQVTY
jgi:hypothetical protein